MFCEKCGNPLPEKARFCNKCGNPIFNNELNVREDKKISLSSELKKWNWGAALLGWIWAIGNRAYLMAILGFIIMFIPHFGWLISIVLFGIKGNEWAWESRQWESIDHFIKVQKIWRNWAIGITLIFLISIIFFTILPLFQVM